MTRPVFPLEPSAALSRGGLDALVTGSYTANVGVGAPIIAAYELSAMTASDGTTRGEFSFFADTPDGTIDFSASVTCLPVDDGLKRAWIGGVITRNGSTRASHNGTNPIHRVGHDVWFRVADRSPGGSDDADRTTSLGFESATITSSAQYCALRPWANDGLPVVSGNVTVH